MQRDVGKKTYLHYVKKKIVEGSELAGKGLAGNSLSHFIYI